MSEQRTISSNIARTFLVQIPNYILTLAAGILVTRQLGPEAKGALMLMTANVQLLVMFLGLNIPGAIQFFMANKKIPPARLSMIAFALLIITTAILFLVLFIIPQTGNLFLAENYEATFFKSYILISFFMTNFGAITIGFIQGSFRFKELNYLTLINSILNFAVFGSLFYCDYNHLFEVGLKEILFFYIVISFVNAGIGYLFFKKDLKTTLFSKFSSDDIKTMAAFLIPSYFSILVNFFNYRLTIWQVNYYEGTENLGYFSLALNFAQMMLLVTISINTVLFPYFSAKSEWKDALKDFGFVIKVNGVIMFFASLFLVLFSWFLVPFFYGSAFKPAVNAVQILSVGTFFCSQSQVFGHFLGARNRNWVNTFVYAIALLCVASLGPVLIPIFGIEGAAIASSASYVLMFIIFCVFLKIKFKIGLLSLIKITRADIERLRSILKRNLKKTAVVDPVNHK
jgi:O-antigen/teichoic acid export membrane protein